MKHLKDIENDLENDAGLISEAVQDVIIIASLNPEIIAKKLIKEQFVVINRKDLEEYETEI